MGILQFGNHEVDHLCGVFDPVEGTIYIRIEDVCDSFENVHYGLLLPLCGFVLVRQY